MIFLIGADRVLMVPAAQAVHELKEVLPVDVADFPFGHGSHVSSIDKDAVVRNLPAPHTVHTRPFADPVADVIAVPAEHPAH